MAQQKVENGLEAASLVASELPVVRCPSSYCRFCVSGAGQVGKLRLAPHLFIPSLTHPLILCMQSSCMWAMRACERESEKQVSTIQDLLDRLLKT